MSTQASSITRLPSTSRRRSFRSPVGVRSLSPDGSIITATPRKKSETAAHLIEVSHLAVDISEKFAVIFLFVIWNQMGYIHLQIKELQNTSDHDLNLKVETIFLSFLFVLDSYADKILQGLSIMVTVDYVTDNYCKIKTLVTKHDASNQHNWGGGLYFRVFTPNKEVSFEIKVLKTRKKNAGLLIRFCSFLGASAGLGFEHRWRRWNLRLWRFATLVSPFPRQLRAGNVVRSSSGTSIFLKKRM